MEQELKDAIKKLVNEAKLSGSAGSAMQYAQAALNLAHTLAALSNTPGGA